MAPDVKVVQTVTAEEVIEVAKRLKDTGIQLQFIRCKESHTFDSSRTLTIADDMTNGEIYVRIIEKLEDHGQLPKNPIIRDLKELNGIYSNKPTI